MLQRRMFVVGGLMTLFLVVVIGITSCGLAEDLASTDLQNSISSDTNQLGSGKWDPPSPNNQNQCRIMFETLTDFRIDINGVVEKYDAGFPKCFDENGKLVEGADGEACFANLSGISDQIKANYVDFQSGFSAYGLSCNQKFEDAPTLISPDISEFNPITPSGIEPPDTWYNGWLTCVQGVHNPEYAFFNLDVELPSLDGQS